LLGSLFGGGHGHSQQQPAADITASPSGTSFRQAATGSATDIAGQHTAYAEGDVHQGSSGADTSRQQPADSSTQPAEQQSRSGDEAARGVSEVSTTQFQQRSQGEVSDDEGMAEADADLSMAQQAQREGMQAEQESLHDSRQSLMQLREAMQQSQGVALHRFCPLMLGVCR